MLADMRRWIEANRPALTEEYMSVEDMLDFVDRLAALLEQAEEERRGRRSADAL